MTNNPTTTSSMQTVVLKVGLHCEGCERRVKKAIWHIKGITSVDVDNNRERVTVTGFVDPSRILKAVKKTGKPVELWKYQNGNKNLFGSQPIANTQSVSKGNKPNNNAGSNKKHTDFPTNIMLSERDRLQHPLPDYHSEVDTDEEGFSGMEFFANDGYSDFKSPKNKKNNFLNDFKPPKNQKSGGFYNEFKPPKNNQKKSDSFSEFKSPKSPKNQKSDYFSDFKPPNDQHQQQKPNSKNRSNYSTNKASEYSNNKASEYSNNKVSEYSNNKTSDYSNNKTTDYTQFGSDDENDFSYHNQKPSFGGGQKPKASPYAGYGNHKDGSQAPAYDFKKSGPNFGSESQGKSQYSAPGFENEEKAYNQKKQKSQVAPKYVSFEDDYQPKSESNRRAEDRGYEQKFFTSQGHEQSYHTTPSYSYTYHENNRVPVSGFTNMFSEENPNACSIM